MITFDVIGTSVHEGRARAIPRDALVEPAAGRLGRIEGHPAMQGPERAQTEQVQVTHITRGDGRYNTFPELHTVRPQVASAPIGAKVKLRGVHSVIYGTVMGGEKNTCGVRRETDVWWEDDSAPTTVESSALVYSERETPVQLHDVQSYTTVGEDQAGGKGHEYTVMALRLGLPCYG